MYTPIMRTTDVGFDQPVLVAHGDADDKCQSTPFDNIYIYFFFSII